MATWNLNRRGPETWTKLASLRDVADLVLVQEARPPGAGYWNAPAGIDSYPPLDLPAAWESVPSGAAPTGIVVLNDRFKLQPHGNAPALGSEDSVELLSHAGTLTVCDVHADDDYVTTVASAYGMFEQRDVSELSMHRIVNEVERLLVDPDVHLVLGGDFNMWIQPWQGAPYGPYREVFERLQSLGMRDRRWRRHAFTPGTVPLWRRC